MEPDNLNSNIQFLTCNTLITSYIVRSKSTHFWGVVWTSFPIHFAHTARQGARQKYTALHENNDIIFHVKASKYQGFDAQVCSQCTNMSVEYSDKSSDFELKFFSKLSRKFSVNFTSMFKVFERLL